MKLKLNKINILEEAKKILKPIKLNPEHRGLFTKFCKDNGFKEVNCQCIKLGLSKGGEWAKRANFARNFSHPECK